MSDQDKPLMTNERLTGWPLIGAWALFIIVPWSLIGVLLWVVLS